MKVLFTVVSIAVIAGLFSFSDPLKNSSGAQPGHTGSPGDGKNCTYCHGGTAQSISEVFSSNIPTSGYVPGETYTISVGTSGSGRKGFQVSPQNSTGALLGTLSAGIGNQLIGGGKYITHSSGVTAPSAQWSFSWTAPPTGTGNVVFYGAFVIGQPNVRLSTMNIMEDETIGIEDLAQLKWNIFPVQAESTLKVNYQLLQSSEVSILLYDLGGRLILNREFGSLPAGDHSEMLFVGSELPENIYLAVLRINNKQYSRKIVI
ncbi:MAG: hypothetical protein IH597_16820 [Bacteroidales bacterium]|nr:hypothetical protein [Bacteroidales bacterium]